MACARYEQRLNRDTPKKKKQFPSPHGFARAED
jgi:hypothetical protein